MKRAFQGFTVRGLKIDIHPQTKEVQPKRIHVGMDAAHDPKLPRFEVERRALKCRPLSVNPNFPLVTAAFCGLRLIRPLLLSLCFPDGPHAQDAAAQAAMFFAWSMSFAGILGALLITASLQRWVDCNPGVPEHVKAQLEPAALVLLAMALVFEVLHEFIAIGSWKYFWSTDIVDRASNDSQAKIPLAFVLVLLHIAGLLGAVMIVIMYARGYRATWQELGLARRTSKPSEAQGCGDLETGEERRAQGKRVADEGAAAAAAAASAVGEKSERPSGYRNRAPSKGSANGAAAAGWGPRQAGREASPRPPDSGSDREATPRGTPRQGKPSNSYYSPPRAGGVANGPRPSRDESPNGQPGGSEKPDRPPLGTPPRAWFWVEADGGGEWVRVRVLRSSATDGTATVRLPGGGVIQTRQSLLRQRKHGDEDPPSAPAAGPRDRPASAREPRSSPQPEKRPPRGPSKERPSSSYSGRGNRPPPGAAVPPGWAPVFKDEDKPETPRAESGQEHWARERMAKLRKELQELDNLPQAERRARLRALQRELHPDKLPEELRAHAQPLFHLVQKEWEVNEAARAESAANAAQNGGG